MRSAVAARSYAPASPLNACPMPWRDHRHGPTLDDHLFTMLPKSPPRETDRDRGVTGFTEVQFDLAGIGPQRE